MKLGAEGIGCACGGAVGTKEAPAGLNDEAEGLKEATPTLNGAYYPTGLFEGTKA